MYCLPLNKIIAGLKIVNTYDSNFKRAAHQYKKYVHRIRNMYQKYTKLFIGVVSEMITAFWVEKFIFLHLPICHLLTFFFFLVVLAR
jgi:hypothetical protein